MTPEHGTLRRVCEFADPRSAAAATMRPRHRSGGRTRRLAVVVLLAAATAAAAQDFPKLKPGLWQMTTTSARRDGHAPQPTSMCLDDSVQQDMFRMSTGLMMGMCSKHDIKVAGSKLTAAATCDLGGTKMQSRAVMTLSGNTAYRTEAHATFDPPMMGTRESTTVTEGRHVGACKPGQRPGDMILPGGQAVNIRQLMMGQKKI